MGEVVSKDRAKDVIAHGCTLWKEVSETDPNSIVGELVGDEGRRLLFSVEERQGILNGVARKLGSAALGRTVSIGDGDAWVAVSVGWEWGAGLMPQVSVDGSVIVTRDETGSPLQSRRAGGYEVHGLLDRFMAMDTGDILKQ